MIECALLWIGNVNCGFIMEIWTKTIITIYKRGLQRFSLTCAPALSLSLFICLVSFFGSCAFYFRHLIISFQANIHFQQVIRLRIVFIFVLFPEDLGVSHSIYTTIQKHLGLQNNSNYWIIMNGIYIYYNENSANTWRNSTKTMTTEAAKRIANERKIESL